METAKTTLVGLNNASFRTSKHADELCSKLMPKLGLKVRHEPARLSIARSLSVSHQPDVIEADYSDSEGQVIRGVQLFGDDLAVWIGLLVEHVGRADLSLREIQDLVRLHWHRGAMLLSSEWKDVGGDFDRFLLQLASRAGIREGGGLGAGDSEDEVTGRTATPIVLRLGEVGTDIHTHQPVTWVMNSSGYAPHMAIMGKAGSGKTRMGMDLIRQVRRQTGAPVLLLDMAKGDLATNEFLIHELGATVLRAPRDPIPLDVLHVPEQTETEARTAAFRFRDSFKTVMESRPGGKQLDALRESAYRTFLSGKPPIRIADVRDRLKEVYAELKQKPDVVSATFNDLTSWELFAPQFSPQEFFSRSWIIDLHDAPETAQRLIVFLLLDAVYAHYRAMKDAPLDADGHRALRISIGIDEARKVLGYGQQSLISLVRESRSKGIALFFMSQSPDDFDQEEDNFLENIGLAVSFNTSAPSARALQSFLGQNIDLSGLAKGVAVTRLPEQSGVVRVKAWDPNLRV